MKSIIALLLVTLAFTNVNPVSAHAQEMTIDQKLEMIKQARAELNDLSVRTNEAEGKLVGGRIVYRVAQVTKWTTGIAGALAIYATFDELHSPKAGKFFNTALISLGLATLAGIVQSNTDDYIQLNETEREQCLKEIIVAQKRLLKLEQGFEVLADIQRQVQEAETVK